MNVASLELCKELYDLSRWGLERNSGFEGKYWVGTEQEGFNLRLMKGVPAYSSTYPAYDLGYLLRKLPQGCCGLFQSKHTWVASYTDLLGKHPLRKPIQSKQADTPEDAACKLAIELFKQGVLVKEES